MSAVIPDSSMVISDIMITESGATDPYILLSFPSRITITNVSFTINEAGLGSLGDGLEYKLYAVKGKKALGIVDPEEAWEEDIVNFFPWDNKPTVVCDVTKFRSNVVAPLHHEMWYTANVPSYEADIAQMDTDEYLTLWIEKTAGSSVNIDGLPNGWDDVRATVTINYTGASGSN